MIVTPPQRGSTNPARIGSFSCEQPIYLQVIGAGTLYIADSADALARTTDAGLNDGLQINQATGIFAQRWKGDLFIAGSSSNVQVIYFAPGAVMPGSGNSGIGTTV